MFVITKIINHIQKKRVSLTIFIVVLSLINPAKAQSAGNKSIALINVNITRSTLLDLLNTLKNQSDYDFFYDKAAAGKLIIENFRFNNATMKQILAKMKKELPLDYQILSREVTVHIETAAQHNQRLKAEQPGKITGKVLDDKGGTLPAANIKVLEAGLTTQSSADGTYQLSLPPGVYTIEVTYVSFQTKRITNVTVKPGENTPLDILLTIDSKSLNEVVVTSSYRKASVEGLYARQKNNAAVTDGITAEQISRTPATNTAQVLAKISGLQISNDRNVVIRGLSDRYNNVLLNGAMVPSSEPNRRDFAFDMIPSALLDNVIVNKTATPDLTGEFTGGLVQVNTKEIPDEDFLQVTVGSGFNTQATGKDILGLNHGNKAWLGFAGDMQKQPQGMSFGEYNKLISAVVDNAPTAEQRVQLNKFLGSIPDNWRIKQYTGQPVYNFQVQGGKVLPFNNDTRLGIVAAVTYRNEQRADEKDLHIPFFLDYMGKQYRYITTLGASLNVGYTLGANKITLQNTYNRRFSDDFWKYKGIDYDNSNLNVDNYNNVTVINALLQSQLGGEHTIGKRGIKLDWNVSGAKLDRDQPYSRVLARGRNDNDPEELFGYNLGENKLRLGSLFNSELNEKLFNWGTNFLLPFKLIGQSQSFKAGYQGKYRSAVFSSNLYRTVAFSGGNGYTGVPYYDVYSKQNFMDDLYLRPISTDGRDPSRSEASDMYNGFQRLNAFYGMLDLKPLEKLRLIGGLRAEKNDQNVFDRIYNATSQVLEQKRVGIKQTDWLPSVNAIYSPGSKFNIRAAWYKSVARPDLRELSSFQYFDYEIFEIIGGTPLKTTTVSNSDLRFEYYPSPGEIISVSGFYKKFKNPIEAVYFSGQIYYTNLLSAKDVGLEVDLRKSFNFVDASSSFWSNLYLSGNFTLLKAQIEFNTSTSVDSLGNPVPNKRDRPLAGQSPYIINGGLLYTGKNFGLNVTYNRFGKRIVYANPDRTADEYENPRDMVDMQLSYKFLKQQKAEFRFNISNLFNQEQFIYINRTAAQNSLGLGENEPTIQRYPGGGNEEVPVGQIDPKGTSYSKNYDNKIRRNKFGTTFTLNFIYRF